jgi:hypothetical protein
MGGDGARRARLPDEPEDLPAIVVDAGGGALAELNALTERARA